METKGIKETKGKEKVDIEQPICLYDFGHNYNVRIQRILRDNHIVTIRELCRQPKRNLLGLHDFGKNSIWKIETLLENYGLCLGMSDKELDEYAGILSPEQEKAEAALWEQRRYEIARELCVLRHEPAYAAVEEADKLIKLLKECPQTDAMPEPAKSNSTLQE